MSSVTDSSLGRWNSGWMACLGFLLAAYYCVPTAWAQYHIDSWATENGLPQNVIREICQTPDGYLWLATLDGLARFDGVRFVVFNRSNTPGIAGNRFTSLYCSGGEEFWAGTQTSGLTRYRQGRFTTYTTLNGLPSNEVRAVSGDERGHIWALSHTSIAAWNEATSSFSELPPEPGYRDFSSSKWFGWLDRGSGFWSIDQDRLKLFLRGHFLDYPLPRKWPDKSLSSAGRDLNGFFWVTAADGSLAKLSGAQWSRFPAGRKQAGPVPPEGLVSVYRDSRNRVLSFGIANDPGAGLVQYLTALSPGQPLRLVFTSLFEDREGNIWVATDRQGLYRLRKQLVSSYSQENGLPGRNAYPVYQDKRGTIWIGTYDGGLARFRDGKFTEVSIPGGPISKRITSISETRDGALWVATGGGLYRMRDGRFELVQNEFLEGREGVRAIHEDREGALWLGTSEGLVRFQKGRWDVITTKGGLASDEVRVIIDGRAGNLWIGSYGGLTSLDHGRYRRWTEADGLPSNSIRSLYEDADGVLWVGTYDGGLGRFYDGRFTRYTVRNGLFSNGVFQILEDSRGYLWMSSNRGIYRVAKSELNEVALGKRTAVFSATYGKSEGMRNEECNGGLWPAGIRAADGKLWFPTQDGVAVIDPDAVTLNPMPPPVAIESCLVDRVPLTLDRAVEIKPGQDSLELGYTALSLINSERLPFKYKMEGLDRDWVDAGTRRTAYYSHLPPGRYRFHVIAANSDGVWNTDGQSVQVFVLPPVYRAWWFLTLASIVAVGLVGFVWQVRVSQLKRANALQHAFSRELIASQERERKRIAADLHDSLGQNLLIINNRALLGSMAAPADPAAQEQFQEIADSALASIEEVRQIAYNLRPYHLDRLGLTQALEAMIERVALSTSIHFSQELVSIDGLFPKESEITIFRIVQESVNNVIKHSQASEAVVKIERDSQAVAITVHDNGRGFEPPGPGASSNGGFGLIGLSERVRILGGEAIIRSGPGRGTTIRITLDVAKGAKARS